MKRLREIIGILIGLQVSGLGTAILFRLGAGSAPGAMITDGVSTFFNISYGIAGFCVNMFFLLLLFFTFPRIIGIGTVMATFFFGIFIDIGTFLIRGIPMETYPLLIQGGFLLLGSLLGAAGLGIYIAEDAGIGALDAPAIIGEKKYGLDFKICRWTQDVLLVIIGLVLGAGWGIGTIVATVLNAPIIRGVVAFRRKQKLKQYHKNLQDH
ncbi:MAG: hypothetical protein Q4P28_05605 [Tissierellia bacterium]|nr:hypothetical protein [Tissierellia bacterium]